MNRRVLILLLLIVVIIVIGAVVLHERCRLGNKNWQLCVRMGIPHAGGPFPQP